MSLGNNPGQMPEGLRVPIKFVEGPTPAQVALANHSAPASAIPVIEEKLFRLFQLIEQVMHPDVSGKYGALLQDCAEDQTYEGVTYLGLMRSPASRLWFNWEGGLLDLVLAQWMEWERLRVRIQNGPFGDGPDSIPLLWRDDADVTDENVLQAIIHAFLPFGWAYWVQGAGDAFQALPGSHESEQLLSPGGKTMLLLSQRDIVPDGHLLHLLFPNPRQRYRSPLSEVHAALWIGAIEHEEQGSPA